MQIISSLSTPRTATSPGIASPASWQTSMTWIARSSCAAKTAVLAGSLRSQSFSALDSPMKSFGLSVQSDLKTDGLMPHCAI